MERPCLLEPPPQGWWEGQGDVRPQSRSRAGPPPRPGEHRTVRAGRRLRARPVRPGARKPDGTPLRLPALSPMAVAGHGRRPASPRGSQRPPRAGTGVRDWRWPWAVPPGTRAMSRPRVTGNSSVRAGPPRPAALGPAETHHPRREHTPWKEGSGGSPPHTDGAASQANTAGVHDAVKFLKMRPRFHLKFGSPGSFL